MQDGSKEKPFMIKQPLVIMFKDPTSAGVICHIYPDQDCNSYEAYGLLICDLVRHTAKAFGVDEDNVWEWVDKERNRPTTDIKEVN